MSEAKSVDEKKFLKIKTILESLLRKQNSNGYIETYTKEILQAFDEPKTVHVTSGIDYKGELIRYEQLEVEIESVSSIIKVNYWADKYGWAVLFITDTKQEAIAFCKRYNLRIKGDSNEK